MTPYYSEPGIDLYQGDNCEVLAALGIKPEDVALLWGDPPYGVRERTDRTSRNPRGPGSKYPIGKGPDGNYRPASRVWPSVVGDDRPFDPARWLEFPRCVFWGANFYASRLPSSPSWWTWDKTDGGRVEDDNADCEHAWTNLGGMPRLFCYLWKGMCQETKDTPGGRRLHPTMKPEALASWGFQRAGLKTGDLVLSPWLGSGPEAAAAKRLGLRFIGIELVTEYLDACVDRLRQGVLFAEGA